MRPSSPYYQVANCGSCSPCYLELSDCHVYAQTRCWPMIIKPSLLLDGTECPGTHSISAASWLFRRRLENWGAPLLGA